MQTSPSNFRLGANAHTAVTDAIGDPCSTKKPPAFAGPTRPSGVSEKVVAVNPPRAAINQKMRRLMTLAAMGWPGKNGPVQVSATPTFSQRTDPPTLDSLQQCDARQLDGHRAFLVSHGAYAPDARLLCVDARTFRRYHHPRFAEAETNCYGDAIGIARRVNPSGVFLGDIHRCETMINGALADGAIAAGEDGCPDDRRQMQFFISEDRADYHVVSRGAKDATWMNKFTGSPRFPVSVASGATPRLSGSGITWIITDVQGETKVSKQIPQDYPIHCPEMLCSLPEKPADPKREF